VRTPAARQRPRPDAENFAVNSWEGIMLLIVYYVIFVIAGDLFDYLIGLIVEREFGSHASLLVFLALYFVVLWLAWLFAVWMTEPKRARASLHGG
jgi:hypothetical protein